MCYSDDARVPLPPISGAARPGGHGLTSSDGTRFGAYFAAAGSRLAPAWCHARRTRPAQFLQGARPAILYPLDALDRLLGRTPHRRPHEGFELMPHVEKTTQEALLPRGARDGSSERNRAVAGQVGVTCGPSASADPARGTSPHSSPDLNGAVGFYGVPNAPFLTSKR